MLIFCAILPPQIGSPAICQLTFQPHVVQCQPHQLQLRNTKIFLVEVPLPLRASRLSLGSFIHSFTFPASMSSAPQYLTGDKQGIKAFLDKFDVCPTSTSDKLDSLISPRFSSSTAMVWSSGNAQSHKLHLPPLMLCLFTQASSGPATTSSRARSKPSPSCAAAKNKSSS